MRAFRDRKRGVHQHRAACTKCGAILSRYNPDPTCAACDAGIPTHAEYLAQFDPAVETNGLHAVDACKRGHDLVEHGRMVHAGDGRMTRRCGLCRKEREKLYQRERRARLKHQIV